MKLLTSVSDKDVTFKLTANMSYPEKEWTVTWVILEARKEDIASIYPKTTLIPQQWCALKKAKPIGSNMYVIPFTLIGDCKSSIYYIFENDMCPTITPVELKYLYEKCDNSYKHKLTNLDEISF